MNFSISEFKWIEFNLYQVKYKIAEITKYFHSSLILGTVDNF